MKFARTLTLLALIALIAAPLTADDKKKGEDKAAAKKKQDGAAKKGAKKGQRRKFDLAAATLKRFEKANLTEEQVAKIKDLAAAAQEKMAVANKSANLTPEQQKARREAVAAAKKDGKKGKDLQAAISAAVQLSDDQKAAFASVREIQGGFQKSVRGLLTDEQAKSIRGPKKGAKKGDAAKKGEAKKKKAAE